MKFCKDCAHFQRVHWGKEFARCKRPELNPVWGSEAASAYCDLERQWSGEHHCGVEAKFFAPRPPTFWQRLFPRPPRAEAAE